MEDKKPLWKRANDLERKWLGYMKKVSEFKPVKNKLKRLRGEKPRSFYRTPGWLKLRSKVLNTYGKDCMKCGAKSRKAGCHVDHIKPKSKFPHLKLIFHNLQVLCRACNKLKGDHDYTDYRPLSYIPPLVRVPKTTVTDNPRKVVIVVRRNKDIETRKLVLATPR